MSRTTRTVIERRGFLARLADFLQQALPEATFGPQPRRLRFEPLEGRSMLAVMAYDDTMYSVTHDQALYGMSVLMNDYDSGMMMMLSA